MGVRHQTNSWQENRTVQTKSQCKDDQLILPHIGVPIVKRQEAYMIMCVGR